MSTTRVARLNQDFGRTARHCTSVRNIMRFQLPLAECYHGLASDRVALVGRKHGRWFISSAIFESKSQTFLRSERHTSHQKSWLGLARLFTHRDFQSLPSRREQYSTLRVARLKCVMSLMDCSTDSVPSQGSMQDKARNSSAIDEYCGRHTTYCLM